MEFWFLKRVEKEALLNQGGKLGKHHSRLNSARSRERASSAEASSSSQPFASGSADEDAAAPDDRGESSNDDMVALNASSSNSINSINAVGDNDNDDNKSSNSNNDEEGGSRDERAGAGALMPSPQQRRAALSQSINSSSGSGPSEAVVADKKRDRDRNHPFYKEESDKSFLWGRAGPLSSCSMSTSTSLDPDAAANAGAASVLPPKIRSGWRGVFRKYHQLERNWKDGNCAVKTLVSRRRVYCILFSEEKQLLWSGNAKGTSARLIFSFSFLLLYI